MLGTSATKISSATRWLLIFGLIAGCSADEGTRGNDSPPGNGGSGGADGGSSGTGGQAAGSGSGGFGGNSGGTGGSSGTGSSGDGTECGSVDVDASRVTPTVELVVDASGSMDEEFDGGSCDQRWTCLRDALVNQNDGLVQEMQGVVRFGLTLFRGNDDRGGGGWFGGGGNDDDMMSGMCPELTRVPADLDNFDAIAPPYNDAGPDGSTPTAQALETVIGELGSGPTCPDCAVSGPPIIILVSDGDPNGCDDNDEETFDETEAQAQAAWDAGIELYVMALADDQNLDHVQRLANIGVGNTPDATPAAPYFEPSNAEELRNQLRSIIGGAAGCEVALQSGEVEGDPSGGEVILNSRELTYQDENGWELVDPTHIRLLGNACDEWLNDSEAILSASFDCSVVLQ